MNIPSYAVRSSGTCPTCGKQMFTSRKKAKAYCHAWRPSERYSVYQCGDYWHFGHIPTQVQRGTVDRRNYVAKKKVKK